MPSSVVKVFGPEIRARVLAQLVHRQSQPWELSFFQKGLFLICMTAVVISILHQLGFL